jgi:hypothetical protein
MPYLRSYRVFISHSWDYGYDYERVVRFLYEARNFRWENLSVPEHDPLQSDDLAYLLRNSDETGRYFSNHCWHVCGA